MKLKVFKIKHKDKKKIQEDSTIVGDQEEPMIETGCDQIFVYLWRRNRRLIYKRL